MAAETESTKAGRTRRDIVQAAIECWSADSSASLGEVAQTAGVGRTTVNRYFSDRAQLIAAVDDECRQRFTAAVQRARPGEGTGMAALQRLCAEIVDLGEVLGLIFADNALVDPDTWQDDDPDDEPFGMLAARGQSDGSIASDLPPEWVGTVVWTTLFAAWLTIKSSSHTRHEASLLLSRTLARGLSD
ncbi:MAG: TetR/AcrR family transcriptional regulator [Propionibacteriaceae bacterium]